MKKKLLFIALVAGLISTSLVSNAQSGRFSLGAEVGFPMGDFGEFYGLGFGTTVRYEHPVGDNIGLSITTGYLVFAGESVDIGGFTVSAQAIGMLPIQAGFKYYFTEQQRGFYAMAELGVHMSMVAAADFEGAESSSSTDLSYAPAIGYALDNWDFGLRYQMISASSETIDPVTFEVKSETVTNSFLGLRIAYVFGSPD
jgi:hypothetical protein